MDEVFVGVPGHARRVQNAAILAIRALVAQPSGMADSPKREQKQRRTLRLSTALRDNLKRRKAQARERAAAGRQPSPASHDSAGIEADKPDT